MEKINLLKIYEIFDCQDSGFISDRVLAYLQECGVIPHEGTYLCPEGHTLKLVEYTQQADGYAWRCWKESKGTKIKKCDIKISIKTKLPLFKVVAFTYLWTKNVSQDFIMDELSLSRHTAVDWSNFCREVVYDGMVVRKEKIGGEGVVLEVDESKFGRRKYHRGHRVEGQWVFGGVERVTNRCFLVPVETRDRETLLEIIKDWILPNTTIVSDCWKAYDCLSDEGFKHFQVNHSLHFKDPETQQHTNTIEGLWRHVKNALPKYHRSKKFFHGYLAKFMFDRSCKKSNISPLENFFKMAGHLYDPRKEEVVEQDEEDEYEIEID